MANPNQKPHNVQPSANSGPEACTVFVALEQPDIAGSRALIDLYKAKNADFCLLLTDNADWLSAGRFKGPIELFSSSDAPGAKQRWAREILERWSPSYVVNLGDSRFDPTGDLYAVN